MSRVIAYIDGFNLYFGLRHAGWRRYYWLDLMALVRSLLKAGQTVSEVHYFTARIRLKRGNEADMQRQSLYLDALETIPDLTIHHGHYLQKKQKCRACEAEWVGYEEKMTDVNIAVQMVSDAFDDRFDSALLISADSDLTTPVRKVLERFPAKRVIVAQPPGRNSHQLSQAATAHFTIGEAKLRHSQLADSITTASGHILSRPEHWK
jgi:uncharacterized LabA/DUF88 family protein